MTAIYRTRRKPAWQVAPPAAGAQQRSNRLRHKVTSLLRDKKSVLSLSQRQSGVRRAETLAAAQTPRARSSGGMRIEAGKQRRSRTTRWAHFAIRSAASPNWCPGPSSLCRATLPP